MAEKLGNFSAIATAYQHIEFRSRLEAKWAIFFDACGWKWSYEPLDLNGWIPDFAIGEIPTLVEVKPFFHDEEWNEGALAKIIASGYRKPVVCLGADATWHIEKSKGDIQIGWLHSLYNESPDLWNFEPLHFGFTEDNDKLGLCPMFGGWENLIFKLGAKPARVELFRDDIERTMVVPWRTACNVSKWIPEHRAKGQAG